MDGEEGHELPPLAEELRAFHGFGGWEKSLFFKDVVPGRLTILQWMALQPGEYGAQSTVGGLLKGGRKCGCSREVGVDLREIRKGSRR